MTVAKKKLLVLAGVCGALIAGCGSSTPKTTGGLASETPSQIIKASAAALRQAGSLRIAGTLTELGSGKRTRVSFALYSKRAFTASMGTSVGNADIILDGTRVYMRADRDFWNATTHHSPVVGELTDRWILFSPGEAHALTSSLTDVTPSYLATCMAKTRGHLSVVGRTTVGGHAAILLRSDGNYPGGQRETIAIASNGPPYPLRLTATGKQRPGGRGGACGGGSGPAQVGTVTLSGFNQLGKLHLPAHATTLKALEQQAAQGQTSD